MRRCHRKLITCCLCSAAALARFPTLASQHASLACPGSFCEWPHSPGAADRTALESCADTNCVTTRYGFFAPHFPSRASL